MAKAKQSVDDSVSLFPFLSILACVIGILVLMITAIALGQIGQDTVQTDNAAEAAKAEAEAKARVEEYKKLRALSAEDEKRAKELKQLLENAAIVRKNLEQVRAELKTLESKQSEASKKFEAAEIEKALKQAEAIRLKAEIAEMEKRLTPLAEQIKKLQAELAKRKTPPEEAQVKILPSGSGTDLDATFVECAQGSLVLYTDDNKEIRVPIAQASSNKDFAALLAAVKAKKDGTVIFLVRPDGVGTYNTARGIARGRGVLNGKLAIAGQGKLDLTLFKAKK